MSKSGKPTSEQLRPGVERGISLVGQAAGAAMFTIKGEISREPDIEWDDDRSKMRLTLDLDQLEIAIRARSEGETTLVLDVPRWVAVYLWGHIDEGLVQDLYHYLETGEVSDALAEVRRALGVTDEPGN